MSVVTARLPSRLTRRIAFAAFGLAWLLVAVAALAELFLVGYAERRATSSLARDGAGVSVSIKARPAAKLLLGRADEVVMRADRLKPASSSADDGDDLGDLIARTGAAGRIDARVGTLQTGRLTLRDASVVKRGNRLSAVATVTRRAIEDALPGDLALSTQGGASAFELTAKATVLGRAVNVRATVGVSRGKLVIAPKVAGIAVLTISLFDDPRVSIDRVSATAVPGGYRFAAEGHLT